MRFGTLYGSDVLAFSGDCTLMGFSWDILYTTVPVVLYYSSCIEKIQISEKLMILSNYGQIRY